MLANAKNGTHKLSKNTPNSTLLLETFENLFKYIRLSALTEEELTFILENDNLVASSADLVAQIEPHLMKEHPTWKKKTPPGNKFLPKTIMVASNTESQINVS